MEDYRRLGELGYVEQKKQASIDFLSRYPGLYLRLAAKRFIYTWTGFWSLRKDYLAAEPFTFPHIALTTTLTVLLLVGAWRAMYFRTTHFGPDRSRAFSHGTLPQSTLPLLLVLASYPSSTTLLIQERNTAIPSIPPASYSSAIWRVPRWPGARTQS